MPKAAQGRLQCIARKQVSEIPSLRGCSEYLVAATRASRRSVASAKSTRLQADHEQFQSGMTTRPSKPQRQ
eukprot:3419484-Rhodomonas_salina.1